jgi:hypothetical protein
MPLQMLDMLIKHAFMGSQLIDLLLEHLELFLSLLLSNLLLAPHGSAYLATSPLVIAPRFSIISIPFNLILLVLNDQSDALQDISDIIDPPLLYLQLNDSIVQIHALLWCLLQ